MFAAARRLLVGLCLAAPTLGFGEPRTATAVQRLQAAPAIDGRLDDALWAAIAPLASFTQATPEAGAAPSRRTEVRLAHDGRLLFVAVRAFDAAPGDIVARTLRRDAESIEADDHVALVLDPQGSARNGFVFRVNTLGAQRDGLVFDGANTRPEWDALWEAVATADADGWSAEFAIPLSALAVPADGRPWGFNIERYVGATGERVRLFGAAAERPVESLADAGALAGIVPEREGWGLRLQPSLRWSVERRGDEAGRDSRLEPALDAFLRVGSGVTATATLNTDFADTELDDRVVNLSRFELFRVEKRLFFTQDSGCFAFGGLDVDDPTLLPFFSRRIGLGRTLDAGLKLSGSAGGVEFGAIAAQVEAAAGADAPRVGVLRAATALDEEQRVGMIATQGNPQGTSGSSLGGLDYQYRSTDVFGGRTLEAFAWAQQSRNAGLGTAMAQGGSLRFPNIGLTGELTLQRIEDRFLPALGYVQEAGITSADGELGWWHRTEDGDNLIPFLYLGHRERLDGSERSHYQGVAFEFSNARDDYLVPELFVETERIAAAFELLPGVRVPDGEHRYGYAVVSAGLSPSRVLSGEGSLRAGGYLDGRLYEQTLEAAWRPGVHWAVSGSFVRQDVRLASGRFIARTSSLRLDHAASTRSEQSLVVQHDNVSEQTTVGVRARWTFAPGRELRAALDHVRPLRADDELQTVFTLKLLWNWAR